MMIDRMKTLTRPLLFVHGRKNQRLHAQNKQWLAMPLRLSAALLAAAVSMATLLPAAASAAPAAGLKAQPVAPTTDSQGVSAPEARKNAAPNTTTTTTWQLSLAASPKSLWPTEYSTLTATANQDVHDTLYYIAVLDVSAGRYIKVCATGSTCSVSVTQPQATTHTYRAYVSAYPSHNSAPQQQAVSNSVDVTWRGVGVSIAANPTTAAVNGTATVTAKTSVDVSVTPFYTLIFDQTTGTRLTYCTTGKMCSTDVTQAAATTHRYIAYVSKLDNYMPPNGFQARSGASFVTWTTADYRVALAGESAGSGKFKLTATANTSVSGTSYYIDVFSLRNGARIAHCNTGTTCTGTANLAFGKTEFVAFVSSGSTLIPPTGALASSNIATAWNFPQ
ncbi:MAG TPA: hypothetical protein VLI54_06465 [Bacillota bacterium]|nr:hypothetical protein [Bacillota bacterium]